MPCNLYSHLRLDRSVDFIALRDPQNLEKHMSQVLLTWRDREHLLANIHLYSSILRPKEGVESPSLIHRLRAAQHPNATDDSKKRERDVDHDGAQDTNERKRLKMRIDNIQEDITSAVYQNGITRMAATAFPFFDLYEESILGILPFEPSEAFLRARFQETINEEYAILRVEQIYRMEARAERRSSSEESVIERLRRASVEEKASS
ncbi:hypothetical protein Dda_4203 [Drechslerella dactyloides]|uniref:Uncharacterized protein n=1 Tax=Drechslerella dactyloides TaxID=74499 RepID=A0AAD6NLU2_DREDA|nr:hypothetical protein Dda_4203 [Drechslerella dactyloides]